MEKCFALSSSMPEIMGNGKIAVYKTLDRRVSHLVIISGMDWPNRAKEECWRCPKCKAFVLPDDKKRKKGGTCYHAICPDRNDGIRTSANVSE